MKTLLIGMMVALLLVGCANPNNSGSDNPESNQSSAETPSAKSPVVAKVVIDGDQIEGRAGQRTSKRTPSRVLQYGNTRTGRSGRSRIGRTASWTVWRPDGTRTGRRRMNTPTRRARWFPLRNGTKTVSDGCSWIERSHLQRTQSDLQKVLV